MKTHPEISPHRTFVRVELPFDSVIRQPDQGAPRELILLLHGYATKGRTIYRGLEDVLPKDALIIAPNGPFPLPRKKETNTRLGFSWYFYDFPLDEYFIDMKPAIQFIKQGLAHFGALDLPKRVIGFSQGGYIASACALTLSNVRQVIGIGASPLADELSLRLPFRLDHVHGDQDEFVSHERSQAEHAKFVAAGTPGRFELISGLGHEVDDRVREVVRQFLLIE